MHEHSHPEDANETLALLRYLAHHNQHHAEELSALAAQVEQKQAKALLYDSVSLLAESNQKLVEALSLLEEA